MIIEYHRPENLEQAKKLLNREIPLTIPLGGGTAVSRQTDTPIAVVDLQSLGLDKISRDEEKKKISIGSMIRLQDLVVSTDLPLNIRKAARRETNINLRRTGTLGGVLVTALGKSPLLGCLLALDVKIYWEPGRKSIYLADWLSKEREKKPGKLITDIEFSIPIESEYDDVARSPEDNPLVFVAVAKWETGVTRVVTGGIGKYPVLVSDDSKNLVGDILRKITGSENKAATEMTEYQRAAIDILTKRLTTDKNNHAGKVKI